MRALSAHLREPRSHGHLPFHPACAVCRAGRLTGFLPSDALLPRGARASVAAALMAVCTLPAAPVAAQEAETEQEGSGAEGGGGEGKPTFEESQEDPEALVEDGEQLEEGQEETAPPVERVDELPSDDQEPQRQDDPGPPAAPPPPSAGGAPDEGERNPEDPPAAGGTEGAGGDPSRPPKAQSTPAPRREGAPKASPPSRPGDAPRTAPRDDDDRARPTPPPPAPSSDIAGPTPSTASRSEPPGPGGPAQTGRIHIVQRGESLWLIADHHLGSGAGAAQIARTVNRLWQLNSTAIATGDPDLLMAGTRLRLP